MTTGATDQFRIIAENVDDVVYFSDPNRQIVWISPSASSQLGWDPEDLRGHRMSELIHLDDYRAVSESRRLLYSGTTVENPSNGFLVRVRRRDDTWRWMSARSTVVLDDEHMPVGVVTSMRDVNELIEARARAEESEHARASSERDFRLIAENASDVVYRASPDGLIEWVSPSVVTMLGYSPDDLVGHPLALLAHPDDVDTVYEMTTAIANGDNHSARVRLRDALNNHSWFEFTANPVWSNEGRVLAHVGSLRDVTAQVRAEVLLRESEETYRLLADNISDVVVRTQDGAISWVSPSVAKALGWAPEQMVGRDASQFLDPAHRERFNADLQGLVGGAITAADDVWVTRERVIAADGSTHWAEIRANHYVDSHGQRDGVLATFHLVDRQVKLEEELLHRATHDYLTGMLNRDEIYRRLNSQETSVREPGDLRAVLFCDLDGLKGINDTQGHAAGDAVLAEVARRIQDIVRTTDLVARIGGDEFLVVLNEIHSLEEAVAVAHKLQASVNQPVVVRGRSLHPTLSIGLSLQAPGESIDSVNERADRALYEAKNAGGNRVVEVGLP